MRLLTVFALLLIIQASLFSATINVPADYTTIQQAIDNATSGDTIVVAAGSYQEQLTIDAMTLTIQGAGIGQTYILSPATLTATFTTSVDYKCIVGVINGGDLTLEDVTVDGQGFGYSNDRFTGIGFRNSAGTVTDCDIIDVSETPLGSTQHGVGIYAYNSDGTNRLITVSYCTLSGYQKAGIAINGANADASISNCTCTGAGQTTAIAQNGIQFAYSADGTIDTCTSTGHAYTGGTLTGAGILLNSAGTTVVQNCPSITDNQTGVYFFDTSGAFTDSTVNGGVNSQGQGGAYYGLVMGQHAAHGPTVSVFGDGAGGDDSSRAPTVVDVTGNTIDADSTGHGVGVGIWGVSGDNVDVDMLTCQISDWEVGIDVWGDGTALPIFEVHNTDFTNNSNYAIFNATTNVVSAEYNWWGDPTGPYNFLWNPDGQGDNVSDNIWFWPWLESLNDLTVPWDHTTIQAAIDVAVTGAKIIVIAGSYEEQLLIDGKTLTLEGAGKGVTNILSPATLATTFVTSGPNKCVVGVINDGSLTLKDLTIDGQNYGSVNYRFAGVGFRNTGGTIDNCEILNIAESPLTSTQHGVGVFALINDGVNRTVAVTDSTITGYQNSGVVVGGANASINITGSTLLGAGQILVTPQNGVQIAYGAGGTIHSSTISNHAYTGATYASCGILLYDGSSVDVVACPSIADNQIGAYYILTSGSFENNTLTSGVNAQGADNRYFGLVVGNDYSGAHAPAIFPLSSDGRDRRPRGRRGRTTTDLNVLESSFTADQSDEGLAIGVWGVNYDNVNLDVDDCEIMNWKRGVEILEDGTAITDVRIFDTDIEGNVDYGVINYTTRIVKAKMNWWGHPTGPYHPTQNPIGQGDRISDNVEFMPFQYLQALPPTIPQAIGVPYHHATIQAAIDAASSGDTITVAAGTYQEQLIIDGKSIEIIGAGSGLTEIRSLPVLSQSFDVAGTDYYAVVGVVNGANLTLRRVTVNGDGQGIANPIFTGVGFRNSQGFLVNCAIKNMKDTPMSSTNKNHGVFMFNDGGTEQEITMKHCHFSENQKTSVSVSGLNTVGVLEKCIIQGVGPTTVIAQNGVQVSYGARASIDGCTLTDHCYTGTFPWTASGVVSYYCPYVEIKNCPEIRDNQTAAYFVNTPGAFKNNTLFAGVNAQGNNGNFYGVIVDDMGSHGPKPSISGRGPKPRNTNRATTVVIRKSSLTSDNSGQGIGISAWGQASDDVNVNVSECEIRNWVWGVEVWDDNTAIATVDISNSSLSGNSEYAVNNLTDTLVTAEYNWWGDATGPYHPTLNPSGLGDPVNGYVWFANWLANDPFGE
jgi:hypothetical protein